MKERPMIFSAESVLAILAGRKTQTRRVIAPPPTVIIADVPYMDNPVQVVDERSGKLVWRFSDADGRRLIKSIRCPYAVGDRLWVRETWMKYRGRLIYRADRGVVMDEGYAADGTSHGSIQPWRSPIHMPRWASRLTLEVTDVRVERLQDITPDDAYCEGIQPVITAAEPDCLAPYRELWDNLNARRGYPWASNPWVLVVAFKAVTQ